MRAIIDFPGDLLPRLAGRFENPQRILQAWLPEEVPALLRHVENHALNGGWAIGMMAYEAASAFDPAFPRGVFVSPLPLAAFILFDDPPMGPEKKSSKEFTCSPWKHDTSRASFEIAIDNIREDIAAGRYYQTNFTMRLHAEFDGDAEAFFYALREAQPETYALFLDFDDWQIASVSPELFFSWDRKSSEIITRPMKGTASSGDSNESLRASEKNRAENLMIVDLLRNDLSRIADHVRVPDLFTVQALPTALQMTSTIAGNVRSGTGLADVFTALFPCGSVTGAPKITAMQAIASYETSARGAYCGALGIITPGGDARFSVGIRTATIASGNATCGIGSGITWDSSAEDEYAEGQIKQRFLWRASAGFELLETMRLENRTYELLQRHLDKLRRSAAYFGFALDENAVRRKLDEIAQQNADRLYRVRLLVGRQGKIKMEIHPLEALPVSVRIKLADKPIDSSDEFLRHKTTNRAVYNAYAPTDPAIFDTLLYNERDEITEFTRGNVIVKLDGKLITPPENCGLIPGARRAELLAKGEMSEGIITRSDLKRATEIWFLNGLRGMIKAKLQ